MSRYYTFLLNFLHEEFKVLLEYLNNNLFEFEEVLNAEFNKKLKSVIDFPNISYLLLPLLPSHKLKEGSLSKKRYAFINCLASHNMISG